LAGELGAVRRLVFRGAAHELLGDLDQPLTILLDGMVEFRFHRTIIMRCRRLIYLLQVSLGDRIERVNQNREAQRMM